MSIITLNKLALPASSILQVITATDETLRIGEFTLTSNEDNLYLTNGLVDTLNVFTLTESSVPALQTNDMLLLSLQSPLIFSDENLDNNSELKISINDVDATGQFVIANVNNN